MRQEKDSTNNFTEYLLTVPSDGERNGSQLLRGSTFQSQGRTSGYLVVQLCSGGDLILAGKLTYFVFYGIQIKEGFRVGIP